MQERRPAFAQPNEGELWVLILEKAFAKHCNSYAGIDGGLTLWALHAMTGDHVFRLTRDELDDVGALNPKNHGRGRAAEVRTLPLQPEGDSQPREAVEALKEYDRCNACLAASISGAGGEAKRSDGLWRGTRTQSCRRARWAASSSQVRNPWGSFEWKGDWSDQSLMWTKHPSSSASCGPRWRRRRATG